MVKLEYITPETEVIEYVDDIITESLEPVPPGPGPKFLEDMAESFVEKAY